MKDFGKPISQDLLNIEDKNRSNLFAWRGQFSPQLIECLLRAYCPPGSIVLDPFAGSGTVLLEAASMGLSAFGFEINPSAWSFSKLYGFANVSRDSREQAILELREKIEAEFPIIVLRQKRVFRNRFGQEIREDILNLNRKAHSNGCKLTTTVGQDVALAALDSATATVSPKNQDLLAHAVSRARNIDGTPLFDSTSYSNYQTRKYVMIVKEEAEEYLMKNQAMDLPTPHLAKLNALLNNPRLPAADKPRVTEALERYKQWIAEMESVKSGHKGSVQELVDATNRYKMFVEL